MADYLRFQAGATFARPSARRSAVNTPTDSLTPRVAGAAAPFSAPDLMICLTGVNPFTGLSGFQYQFTAAPGSASPVPPRETVVGWDSLTFTSSEMAGGHYVTSTAIRRGAVNYVSTELSVLDVRLTAPQLFVALHDDRPSEYDLLASELLLDLSGLMDFDDAPYIPGGAIEWGQRRLTDLPAQPLRSGVMFAIRQPPAKDNEWIAPWGLSTTRAYETKTPYKTEPPIVIPGVIPAADDKKVHALVNLIDVIALPNGEPLLAAGIRIDADEDTYSWKLTADILSEGSLALLTPDSNGYKELAVIINGHRFEFFIPEYSASRRISIDGKLENAWRISGFSRSQYLGTDYAPKRTRSTTSISAVQAATAELTGTGFALDWDTSLLPDWPLPNSAFSYQGLTPIEVIKRLATAAGGVLMADPAANTLLVRPRHKVPAWELLAADMDRALHESQIQSESAQRAGGILYNAVDVSGEAEGVLLTVSRLGTAGDYPAEDVSDPWLTHIDANRARGISELSGGGDRMRYTFEVPVPESEAQPGLLVPGLTLAVLHDDSARDFRGYVRSLSLYAPGEGDATVTQTITVDRPLGWEGA